MAQGSADDGGFDKVIATGHSLGGVMVENLLADAAFVSTWDKLADAYGVTFGSPGSTKPVPASAKLINFVNLADPIAMLNGGDFFGFETGEAQNAQRALLAVELALIGLDPTKAPEAVAEEALLYVGRAGQLIPERDGKTITLVSNIRTDLGGPESHLIEPGFLGDGYAGTLPELLTQYGSANRPGFQDLDFWLEVGDGWYPTKDFGSFELGFVLARGVSFSLFDMVAAPTIRLGFGALTFGVDQLQALPQAFANLYEIGAIGVTWVKNVIGSFITGSAEALSGGFSGLGSYAQINYIGPEFNKGQTDLEPGSVIIKIDLDSDGAPEITTRFEGDYDLSRFFVVPEDGNTRVIYALEAQLSSTEARDYLIGSAAGEEIVARAGDDVIFAEGGADTIRPGLGADEISTGDGADGVIGDLAELDGIRIADFSPEDRVIVEGVPASALILTASREGTGYRVLLEGPSGAAASILMEDISRPGAFELSDSAAGAVVAFVDNRAPLAIDDGFVFSGGVLSGPATLLLNDSDPDGDPISVAGFLYDGAGDLDITADGAVSYTAAAGFSGVDRFSYTVVDPFGGSATAQVAIEVSAPEPAKRQVVLGYNGDRSIGGTQGDDIIVPGRAILTQVSGHGGADVFVFGERTGDVWRDRLIIRDYEVGEDSIDLGGAQILRVRETADRVEITLDGRRGDLLTVEGVSRLDALDFTDVWSAGVKPPYTLVLGGAFEPLLLGTGGDDILVAGKSIVTGMRGGSGDDVFVFGGSAGNNRREVATIFDYDPGSDAIDLDGAEIRSVRETARDVRLTLEGGRGDSLIVRGVNDFDDLAFSDLWTTRDEGIFA